MAKQDEASPSEAAFHEAGHALLISRSGYQIESIEVFWDESNQRWEGKVNRHLTNHRTKLDAINPDVSLLIQESLIAVAGCLAQTIHLAREQDSNASFHKEQNWGDFLLWMQNTNAESRLAYPLEFSAQEQKFVVKAHPRSFGGRDQAAFMKCLKFIESTPCGKNRFLADLLDPLVQTALLISERTSWDKIRKLAESLITELSEAGKGRIESETVNELLIGPQRAGSTLGDK